MGLLLDMQCVPALYPDTADTGTLWFMSHTHRVAMMPSACPLIIGVFWDQPFTCMLHCIAVAQLHRHEPVEWAKLIPVPIIHMFHVDTAGNSIEGIACMGQA